MHEREYDRKGTNGCQPSRPSWHVRTPCRAGPGTYVPGMDDMNCSLPPTISIAPRGVVPSTLVVHKLTHSRNGLIFAGAGSCLVEGSSVVEGFTLVWRRSIGG